MARSRRAQLPKVVVARWPSACGSRDEVMIVRGAAALMRFPQVDIRRVSVANEAEALRLSEGEGWSSS
jgi:hypothetical protein